MIKYAYLADQTIVVDLCKKVIKTRKSKNRVDQYLNRLKSNNINSIDILYELSAKGCTYAFVANILINQFLMFNNFEYDDEKFKNIFGFSLMADNETIDYNILMVDIFSSLYNIVKIDIHNYNLYCYDNSIEAACTLLNFKSSNESEASLKLFEAGFLSDGKNSDGKNRYKNRFPKNNTLYGTYEEIANILFGIKKEDFTMSKLKEQFNLTQTTFDISFEKPESKFSGILQSNNLNFWVNYYLTRKGININFNSNHINIDFTSYDQFVLYIEKLLKEEFTIGVSSNLNSNINIKSSDYSIEAKISTDKAGHQMTMLGFDNNNDIVVESWGKQFVILKENYKELNYIYTKVNYDDILKKQTNGELYKTM